MNHPSRFPLALLGVTAALTAVLASAPWASGQTPVPVIVPIALAPLQSDTPLELVALTLDADISESAGHTLVTGNSTFKIHNTDRLNDLQAAVGFPGWAGDPYAFDPTRLASFAVSIDGQKVKALNPARADLKIGSTVRTVDWYTFTVSIAGDEKKTVQVDFSQDLGDAALPRFVYGLVPGAGWKGSIGSARLTLRFPEMTTSDQIVSADPVNPEFDGTSVTWRFTNHEPPINPSLILIRPSVWDDLNNKRRAAQSLSDASASAALGNLLRQLALIDSPRRDSFYAQAVAELETAVRLDPNQRGARQALATLYESRAGPAAGPRQPAYVLLAVAQWEALAADSNARKQLAEDYFYLGLDAQTRRAFADAQTYFDKAQSLAPAGAGPLFTSARLVAQRRALNLAWARTLIEQNDAAGARDKARAALDDRFMATFNPPPFNVSRTQVQMTSNSRSMAFTLSPFAAGPAEMQNALSGVAATLRASGAEATFGDAFLGLTVRFADDVELTNKLAVLEKALPNGTEWSIVRSVLSPSQIMLADTDEVLTHSTRYREDIDLSTACDAFSAQIGATTQNLSPLDSAPSSDDEAQLKRALLKYAQAGWQNALAQSRVSYQVGANQARVETCAAQSVTIATSTILPLRVALVVGVIEFVGVVILIARWRAKGQRRQRPKSL